MRALHLLALSCLLGTPALAAPPRESHDAAALNSVARQLAGVDSTAQDQAYQTHAKAMQKAWKQVDQTRLLKMRTWAKRELGALEKETYVFYPFSGPDSLHQITFFPNATTSVLCGLEKVGVLPDLAALTPEERATELGRIRSSLTASLNYSFFKTNDMKVDLKDHALGGVLPILYTYAALLGDELKSVELLNLDGAGNLVAAGPGASAARLTFTVPGSTQVHTLVYCSWDLSDHGLKGPGEAFLNFARKGGRNVTYLKSASYLMHSAGFSTIRGFILQNAKAVLQDDSGIPHRFFKAEAWTATPYGAYDAPIRLFKERAQEDLKALYGPATKPLGFGIGYQFRGGTSNLALYTAKK
jgi:hypothetical protein